MIGDQSLLITALRTLLLARRMPGGEQSLLQQCLFLLLYVRITRKPLNRFADGFIKPYIELFEIKSKRPFDRLLVRIDADFCIERAMPAHYA